MYSIGLYLSVKHSQAQALILHCEKYYSVTCELHDFILVAMSPKMQVASKRPAMAVFVIMT